MNLIVFPVLGTTISVLFRLFFFFLPICAVADGPVDVPDAVQVWGGVREHGRDLRAAAPEIDSR